MEQFEYVDKSYLVCPYKHKHVRLKINQKFVSIEERVLFSFVKGLINNPLSLFQKIKKSLTGKFTRETFNIG